MKNKIIVFTNGCFDIIHPGHIKVFKEASKLGDKLVVGVNSDNSIKRLKGKNRPVNTLEDRIIVLQSIRFIDEVIPFDDDTPIKLIKKIRPNIIVKGGDYSAEEVVGNKIAEKVHIVPLIKNKSTTNIIKKLL